MLYYLIIFVLFPLIVLAESTSIPVNEALNSMSLLELEQRQADIKSNLKDLAYCSLRSGVGSIGFRSNTSTKPEQTEWVEIDLGKEFPIDEIVLVPTLWRDAKESFRADGFPAEFSIIAGCNNDRDGTVIVRNQSTENILPRIAPLVIPANNITASWIRIVATKLSPRAFDNQHVLQFSEIFVFSGASNVALRQPVTASSIHPEHSGSAWNKRFLVDGFLPYLMDAAHGRQSLAYICRHHNNPRLVLDLGDEYPISGIHLHAVDQSDTVPQAFAGDLGIPQHLLIQGANSPDFSDAKVLLDKIKKGINSTGPILMWSIPETVCRYVRISDVSAKKNKALDPVRIGFAEIELLSKGQNVALGKPTQVNLDADSSNNRSPVTLTDGCNLYGSILPIRTWMNQLAQAHDLEAELPRVAAELNLRYATQRHNIRLLVWLAVLLTLGISITIFIDRFLRMRQVAKIRERIAADLHDELGANIHTIGLLSDAAASSHDSPDEWKMLHQRIRQLTERTGTAIRNFSDIVNDKGLYHGLAEDMQRAAQRITAKIDHTFEIKGDQYLNRLKPRVRVDLFLFYKESLINICRHSNATLFNTKLVVTPRELVLTVSDNGQGLSGENIPKSLKRRAHLLKGKLTLENTTKGGTSITLRCRMTRFPKARYTKEITSE